MRTHAGKSLRLLKNSEQGGSSKYGASGSALPTLSPLTPLLPSSRASKAGLHRAAKQRAPLQQQFLDRLHSFLAGHELWPAALPASTHAGLSELSGTAQQPPQLPQQQWQQQQGGQVQPNSSNILPHGGLVQPNGNGSLQPLGLPLQPALPLQHSLGGGLLAPGPRPPHASLAPPPAAPTTAQQGGFAARMAAAGLEHSVLRTGGASAMGPDSHERLQPALSMHAPIAAGTQGTMHAPIAAGVQGTMHAPIAAGVQGTMHAPTAAGTPPLPGLPVAALSHHAGSVSSGGGAGRGTTGAWADTVASGAAASSAAVSGAGASNAAVSSAAASGAGALNAVAPGAVAPSVLEAQFSCLAAAMSRPRPCLAWESERGRQPGRDGIRCGSCM